MALKRNDKVALKENPKIIGTIIGVTPSSYKGESEIYQVQWVGYSQSYLYVSEALISEKEAHAQESGKEATKS